MTPIYEYELTPEGLPLSHKKIQSEKEKTDERTSIYIVKNTIILMGTGIGSIMGQALGGLIGYTFTSQTSFDQDSENMILVIGILLGTGAGANIGNKVTSTIVNFFSPNEKHIKIL